MEPHIEALLKRAQLAPFGPVWDGAGVRGFSREGYWYHGRVPGLSFERSTFVAKTVTTFVNKGNTRLTKDHVPVHWFPSSIVTYLRKGMMLNAVGLSNPGFDTFLTKEHWFSIPEPFFISYMPVLPATHRYARDEVRDFVDELGHAFACRQFRTHALGLQLNISCPNVGADLVKVTDKAAILLDQLEPLSLPIVVKLNLLVSPEAASAIAAHPACTGLCITNSIPFGTVLPSRWWAWHFPIGSPLTVRGFGEGGLSGAPLLRLVEAWLRQFREEDATTYVNAGGGILHPDDVDILKDAGADSVFISSAAVLRPWRVGRIIERAHRIFAH